MTFFGLKSGQDLKNRAAHHHQEFPGVPPPPPNRARTLVSLCSALSKQRILHDMNEDAIRLGESSIPQKL